MCCIFTLSVYRPRSLGELGACCSQRQLDRKCKPLCWRVGFCSDKNCSYKGPLYSARGPQRGGAERAHLANPPPCELPSVISECLWAQAHLPPPSHWGHWGVHPETPCTVSLPLHTPSCRSPSAGTIRKPQSLPVTPVHSHTYFTGSVKDMCVMRVKPQGDCDHIPARCSLSRTSLSPCSGGNGSFPACKASSKAESSWVTNGSRFRGRDMIYCPIWNKRQRCQPGADACV